jgi:hypothetical protein
VIRGQVTDNRLQPIPFASVVIKDSKWGTRADLDGHYEIALLAQGEYTVVASAMGYKSMVQKVALYKDTLEQHFLLEDASKAIKEVEVKAKKVDRSEEIIRMVIARKETWLNAMSDFSAAIYIKAVQEDVWVKPPKGKAAADTAKAPPNLNLAEIKMDRYFRAPDKVKEIRTGYQARGNTLGLFYLTSTDADFNFFRNLVKAPALSETPALSPFSYSGLVGYRYKMQKIYNDSSGRKVYQIKVTPGIMGNSLCTGYVEIYDSTWTVKYLDLEWPAYHLAEYDKFVVRQWFTSIDSNLCFPIQQEYLYQARTGKKAQSGRTAVYYSNIVLKPELSNRFFNNEVSVTSKEAYERDSSFWTKERREPLSQKEISFIRYSDSVKVAHQSKPYLDSVDKVFNRITPTKVLLTGQGYYRRSQELRLDFAPLVTTFLPFYIGGPRLATFVSAEKTFPNKKQVSLFFSPSYGIRNHDLKGSVSAYGMYNTFSRAFVRATVGRDFAAVFAGDSYINMIRRTNYYENTRFELVHSIELFNGFRFTAEAELANRRSISHYNFNTNLDTLFNEPNQPPDFQPYNALYGRVAFSYTPFQKYIRQPLEKVILGSSWPTFTLSYRKGIPGVFNSTIDFDYLQLSIEKEFKLGLVGISQFRVSSGKFLSTRKLELVDYKFMRRGDPFIFSNPLSYYQALDSTFPVFEPYFEGHYLHKFNGAILNKIPFLKQLKLMEIAGGGLLYVPENNLQYIEGFVGIEKVIRLWESRYKIGVVFCTSYANRNPNPFQFKITFDQYDIRRNSWSY